MSLIKYGIAVGYHIGRPQGGKQLQQLRRQVRPLSKRPEVPDDTNPAVPARIAGLRGPSRRAAGRRRSRFSTSPTPAGPTVPKSPDAAGIAAAPIEFGGRTTAEYSEAASTLLVPPSPHRTHHAAIPDTAALRRKSPRSNRP